MNFITVLTTRHTFKDNADDYLAKIEPHKGIKDEAKQEKWLAEKRAKLREDLWCHSLAAEPEKTVIGGLPLESTQSHDTHFCVKPGAKPTIDEFDASKFQELGETLCGASAIYIFAWDKVHRRMRQIANALAVRGLPVPHWAFNIPSPGIDRMELVNLNTLFDDAPAALVFEEFGLGQVAQDPVEETKQLLTLVSKMFSTA